MSKIDKELNNKNGYYVYAYYDPTDKSGVPFYVGKGHYDRCFAHLIENNDSRKVKK